MKILNRFFAKSPISSITPVKYQLMIIEISPEYARTTVQGVNTTTGMMFRQAIKDKILKNNPQDGVVIPKKRRTVEEIETDSLNDEYLER